MKEICTPIKEYTDFNLMYDDCQNIIQSVSEKYTNLNLAGVIKLIRISYDKAILNSFYNIGNLPKYVATSVNSKSLVLKISMDSLLKNVIEHPEISIGEEQCYEILMLKGGYKEGDIPTLPTFIHRLKHEFSKDAIKKMRSHNKLMPVSAEVEALQIHKKRKKPCEVYFEDAANDYWRAIVENNIEVGKHRQEFISKLITYFRGIKLGEIVREKVIDFKNTLLSEGVTFSIVKGLIGMLFTILKASGIKIDFEIYQDLNHSSKIYTQEEVKKIILNDSPEALVVALGLRLGELQALKYEDFDFENKLVTIKRRNEYGRIKEFKQAKFIRQCIVPDIILNRIDKSKKGFIYGKITMPTYESCLYAHIMLMQTQHIPMNIIAHNMGHSSISSFFATYHYLFPKHLEETFNILKPLNLEEHQC